MTFAPEFLDEVRARAPLAGTIGRRLKLIKRGREYVALCPFHNEKTPSFTINEDKGFFHCFGCGAHGDVIGYVMRTEGLPFPEAVAKLAGEAGLALPQRTPEDRALEEKRATLHDVLEAACAWFEVQLAAGTGTGARGYLERRGLAPETIAEFRLGYAPAARGALKQALAARDFAEPLMVEAGLLVAPEDKKETFDRFRDRVIFPIMDRRGRVIAFGGRALGKAKAKYLNSPETPLFHKGGVLYNLARARAPARRAGTVVVAEGYTDVIALWAAGFEHAVAPLGTALTEAHIQDLWRLAPEPVLCLDGDEAGRRAARRAAERALPLLEPGYSLRFALLPGGEDPDSFLASKGAGAMAQVIEGARPLSDILWEMGTANRKADTPERRAAMERTLLDLTREIRDKTVAQYYVRHFKDRLWRAFGARRAAPAAGLRRGGRDSGRDSGRDWARDSRAREGTRDRISSAGELATGTADRARRCEELLVLTVINHLALLERVVEPLAEAEFATPELDSLRREIIDIAGHERSLDTGGLKFHLSQRGLSEIVDRLVRSGVTKNEWFAGEAAAPEDAEIGWNHTLARHRAMTLRAELEAAEAELARDMTPESQARLFALKKQVEASAGDEAEVESYGVASGRQAGP